jgi:hypothetical protein
MDKSPTRSPRARVAVAGFFALLGIALLAMAWRMDRRWIEVHMTPYCCAEYAWQLARGRFARFVCGVAGALLLVVASPLAARWAARRSAREIAMATVRVLVAAMLAVVVTDVVLRIRRSTRKPGAPLVLAHYEPETEMDDRFWFRPKRNTTTEMKVGDKLLRFVIDDHGCRLRSETDRIDPARPSILFTGESIASGFGLNYEETYPSMLAERLGVQAVNVAVQGSALDSAYARLADELPRFSRPLATVTLVMQMAIERGTWWHIGHVVFDEDGVERFDPSEPDSWYKRSPLRELLFETLYHSDERLRRARAIFRATARDAKARGAVAVFLLTNCGTSCLPDETGASSIDRILFEGLDVVHVRVDLDDKTFDYRIGHPDVRGHRLLADAIERALREHGVTGPSAAK